MIFSRFAGAKLGCNELPKRIISAPHSVKSERIANPYEMVRGGRRQPHSDVEVNLLPLGNL
jgi:hypothetical protein